MSYKQTYWLGSEPIEEILPKGASRKERKNFRKRQKERQKDLKEKTCKITLEEDDRGRWGGTGKIFYGSDYYEYEWIIINSKSQKNAILIAGQEAVKYGMKRIIFTFVPRASLRMVRCSEELALEELQDDAPGIF